MRNYVKELLTEWKKLARRAMEQVGTCPYCEYRKECGKDPEKTDYCPLRGFK